MKWLNLNFILACALRLTTMQEIKLKRELCSIKDVICSVADGRRSTAMISGHRRLSVAAMDGAPSP